MKISFVEMPSKHGKYTYRLLHKLLTDNGIDEYIPDEADLILLSVDDIDDLPYVRNIRRQFKNKKIIAGGFECFQGEYLLKYCDALVVGEGYEFFKELSMAKSIDDLLLLPYVWTIEKNTVTPSTFIDETKIPIVRLTKNGYYYLAGRGCSGKCSFCATGFVYPLWRNSEPNLYSVYNTISKKPGAKITFITNDSVLLPLPGVAQSVRVKTYLQNPAKYSGVKFLHFGIEGFSEERRRYFYKFIANDDIYHLIDTLEDRRQEAEFFFILGFPNTFNEMMTFAESIPVSTKTYPTIHLKLTQFNCCPHTPLWTYDYSQFEFLTDEQLRQFRAVLSSRNVRFRMFAVRSNTRSFYRAMMRRASYDEVDEIERDPRDNKDIGQYFEFFSKNYPHLVTYDGRPMPASQIVTPYRKIRDKMAKRLGMAYVNYKCDTRLTPAQP